MANVISALAPVLYSAAREVPRETTGLIAAVTTDFDDKGVAKGDTCIIGVSPTQATADVTAAQTFTAGTDRTATSVTLTLNQFKGTSWNLTAEQERSLINSGVAQDILKQSIVQGIRAIVNQMETYLGTTIRAAASRATGTAATTPFASTINILTNSGQILTDNGAMGDRQCVLNTAAGANLRSVANLYKANEAGNSDLLRRGVLGDLFGFAIRESAGIPTAVTAGTGTSYTSSTAGFAVGTTSIPIITGSGTVLAGDVVTFTGDSNKYVVKTGVAAPGTIVIQEPGLKVALAASAVAMTIGSAATANLTFARNAVVLVARPALQPEAAHIEQTVITDPQTKLSFLLMRQVGDSMASWYLRSVYDAFVPNGYAVGQLLG